MTDSMCLNWDVLTTLFSHFERRKDMLALMSTCHTLRSAGAAHLLKFFVAILTDHHLASFCRFLLAGAPTRLAALKQLAIRTYPVSSTMVEMYLEVLAGAHRLRNFEVWCGSPIVDSRIYEAVSRLPNLDTLTIRNFVPERSSWLQKVQSPVRDVGISFHGRPVNPFLLLSNFALSLEKLRVVFACQGADIPTVVYPRLHTFVASSSVFEKVAPLVNAMPNLRDLTVYSCRGEDDDDEIIIDRLENQQAQMTHRWGTMDRVVADVLVLYRLGLACRVRRLEIPWLENTYQDSPAPTFKDMFSTVLTDTRPSTLTLILRATAFDMSQFATYMNAFTPGVLKKLIITLYITCKTDIPATFDYLFVALRDLRITHLVVRVKWLFPVRDDADKPRPAELLLKNMDTRQLATRLVKESQSLRYFFVELVGQDMVHWEIRRQTGPGHSCDAHELSFLDAIAAMDGEAF